ncbi:MAG: hypothetical protein IT428_09545 [Planctomycetaceae bacterium]|jgi:hypothetical protein|nr:hypothetical protein [Planctomycetaceae bacterium]
MSETLTIGLTKQQRDLLLRGLRYVRSSVLLEPRDPSEEVDSDRRNQLREIGEVVSALTGSESKRGS